MGDDLLQAGLQADRGCFQPSVGGAVQLAQGRKAGGRGEGVPAERPALVHGAERGHARLIRSELAPNMPTGRPPPMTLPKHHEGRDHPRVLGGAEVLESHPEPGDHLVEELAAWCRTERSQAVRRPSRNLGAGGTSPMLAATGSTVTTATSSDTSGTSL